MKMAVIAAVVGLVTCGYVFAADVSAPAAEPAQGVTGKILKMEGNFMPSIGQRANGGQVLPISVPVHVFKGKLKSFEKPDPKHPQLVATVRSDKDGVYRVALEPGEYTIVAEINGRLYLNSYVDFEGGMGWSTVIVAAGKWTTFDIKDSSAAVF